MTSADKKSSSGKAPKLEELQVSDLDSARGAGGKLFDEADSLRDSSDTNSKDDIKPRTTPENFRGEIDQWPPRTRN